ncbi:MAG: MBOAT family protein [Gemmataceae bacterium]|nr:MBOAT family protein [Gemmataceae bacterium]
MVFSSTIFLFGFLPLVLLLYHLSPRVARNTLLLFASLFFYYWGEKGYSVILMASILGNYAAGVLLARSKSPWLLAAAVAGNLLVLIGFKYSNFIADNINFWVGSQIVPLTKRVHLPIGVSFFTFQGIAYVVDVYTRVVPPAPNPVRYALYAALFPHLVAGPIVRYRDIVDQLGDRPTRLEELSTGVRRLTVGLAKKLIIANTLGQYADIVFRLPASELSAGLGWLGLVCYSLQIYFDFSGYSDMAIGLGKMFGFTFLENFNYPYIARSVTEFWRRWHISLSSWLRDYVYIPLGGNRVSPFRTYMHLLLVFVLCGFWHGASWNFLIWGVWHGVFLVIERLGLGRILDRLPGGLGWAYTIVTVMIGWVFFRADTLPQATQFIAALTGQGSGLFDFGDVWNREIVLALVLAIPACTPVVPWLASRIREGGQWATAGWELSAVAVCSLLWLILLPCLCAGAYNPFLYFRF